MEEWEYQQIASAFLNAREITRLFEDNCVKIENELKSLILELQKNEPDLHGHIRLLFFDKKGIELLTRYICLINPYFSALKTGINLLQKSIQKKYDLKISKKKGYTIRFFKRFEQEKPDAEEYKILKKYDSLVMEIKDTRDRTEHVNPKTIVRFRKGEEYLLVPIYKVDLSGTYHEERHVHFLTYMKETNSQIGVLFKEIYTIDRPEKKDLLSFIATL